jgi:hypothetical protein
MRVGGLLAVACATALLSGCGVPTPFIDESPFLPTDVAPDSRPAFLDDPIDPERALPQAVADAFALDVEGARYQGEWYGEDVYLYSANDILWMVGVDLDDPESWHTGGGFGNSPFAWESGDTTDDEWFLQYVPQGTADLPDGWTAFSPWIASRDL